MDTNTGESQGHKRQSQQLGNSPSEEDMGYWTPTGAEPMIIWKGGWMDGWVGGWMDEWVDGWLDG